VEPSEPPSGFLNRALVKERVQFTVLLVLITLEAMGTSSHLLHRLRLRGLAEIHELTEDSAVGSTLVHRASR
jgi:hypothetical protein